MRRRPVGRGQPGHPLYVEWSGPAAVISHADDSALLLWQLLRNAAIPGDDVLITLSDRALADPGCGAVLRTEVESAVREWGVGQIWVATDGLGHPRGAHAAWLQRLAERTGVELLAPDGPAHVTPDGTFYVAAGTGASGWRSFRPRGAGVRAGHRLPVPAWEHVLPDRPLPLPGAVASPIPAGVLLQARSAAPVSPADPAYHVPLDPRGPALVLRDFGEPPVDPAHVAELFAQLPPRTVVRIETVLLDPATRHRLGWLDKLGAELDALHVRSAHGDLAEIPTVRRPLGEGPALVDSGWVRTSDRRYRLAGVKGLLAGVIPEGILLRDAGAADADEVAFVAPDEGVLTIVEGTSPRLVELLCQAVERCPEAPGVLVAGPEDDAGVDRLAGLLSRAPIATTDRRPASGHDATAGASTARVATETTVLVPLPRRPLTDYIPQIATATAAWGPAEAETVSYVPQVAPSRIDRTPDNPPPAALPRVDRPPTPNPSPPSPPPAALPRVDRPPTPNPSPPSPPPPPPNPSPSPPSPSPSPSPSPPSPSSPSSSDEREPASDEGESTPGEDETAPIAGNAGPAVIGRPPLAPPAPLGSGAIPAKPRSYDDWAAGFASPKPPAAPIPPVGASSAPDAEPSPERGTSPVEPEPKPEPEPVQAPEPGPAPEPEPVVPPRVDPATSWTPSSLGMPLMTVSGPDLEDPEPDSFAAPPMPEAYAPPALDPLASGDPYPPSVDEPAAEVAPVPDDVTLYQPAGDGGVADRGSTTAERRDFVAALGPAYTNSITTVNAALAAWPALRHDISADAKTDLVAVRLFFGRSEAGAARLNATLRQGGQPDLPGYVPCLVSGLRRLPPSRRAMLCQGRLNVPAHQLYPEGAIVVEAGFRIVAGVTELTIAGADVDYLVWPRSAHQVGMLSDPTLDEAVFLAGTRFKVLAVRENAPAEGEEPLVPATAVLLRELQLGEESTGALNDADRSALTRLDRALKRRRSATSRPIEDLEAVDRLVGPPLGFTEA